jgi:hypothetical protein
MADESALARETPAAGQSVVGNTQVMRGIALALLASLVLLQLPFGGLVLYPFKVLNTWMHEISHGVVMLLTGVGFDRMDVYPDGSGLAFADGTAGPPGRALIAAAGYMGTPLWGVVLLWLGQSEVYARRCLAVVGFLLGLTTAMFVANRFGQITLGITALVVVGAGIFVPGRVAAMLCNFIAAQACIGALVDIRVLYRPFLVVDGHERGSDAHQMAAATFGTSEPWAIWFWATAWLVWSLALLYVALRLARRRALVDRGVGGA